MAALAILLGGYSTALAQEPCTPCYQTECTTPQCQAQEGFETVGEGAKQAAVGSYNTVAEGTENAYNTVAEGTENVYEKSKTGVENAAETVAEGTVNTYEKAKSGAVNLWNQTKAKIHEATE